MGTGQKVITTCLWALLVLGMMGLVGTRVWLSRGAKADTETLPILFSVPKFSLIDQSGKPFTDERLKGRPWVGAFVFTHCAGPCPLMFSQMSQMQAPMMAINVRQVCFSVDPDRDTPEVLQAKAKELGADDSSWFFLTSDRPTMDQLLREMLQPKAGSGDDPLMHDTKFYLFDSQGRCRGRYSSQRGEDLAKLHADAATLAAEANAQMDVSGGKPS